MNSTTPAAAALPTFVINLDSQPGKLSDVLSRISGCANSHVLDVQRFRAVNAVGKSLEDFTRQTQHPLVVVSLFASRVITMGERRYHAQMTSMGAIGCYLSHFSLWKKCVELNRPIVVMEDDVAFSQPGLLIQAVKWCVDKMDADEVDMVSFDFLNMYSVTSKDHPVFSTRIGSLHRIVRPFFGLAMYMIHPRAAALLVETALPIEVQVDAYISMRSDPYLSKVLGLKELRLYGFMLHGKHRIAFQQNSSSSIQRDDCETCERNLAITDATSEPDPRNRFGSSMSLLRDASQSSTASRSSTSTSTSRLMIICLVCVIVILLIILAFTLTRPRLHKP
jgi:GR25 family glycosyltransferase involved in LPS biosynthesis